MAVQVVFMKVGNSLDGPLPGNARARESLAVAASPVATTTNTVQAGEIVYVYNGESTATNVAWGSTPDPSATAETQATTAGVPVAATTAQAFAPPPGVNIAVDTLA